MNFEMILDLSVILSLVVFMGNLLIERFGHFDDGVGILKTGLKKVRANRVG